MFDIVIEVESSDLTVKTVSGKICSYPCAIEGNDPAPSFGCQFPAQYYNGHYDPAVPSSEDGGCFK